MPNPYGLTEWEYDEINRMAKESSMKRMDPVFDSHPDIIEQRRRDAEFVERFKREQEAAKPADGPAVPGISAFNPHGYVRCGRSKRRPKMDTSKSDVAWLIEKPQSARPGRPPTYWGYEEGYEGWTCDINEAIRFETREAADMRGSDCGILEYEVIEHAWTKQRGTTP